MKKITCLLFIFNLSIMAHSTENKPQNKKQVIMFQMEIQDNTSLRLIGNINLTNIDTITSKINNNPQINKLIITSGGGEVTANIKLAYLLKEKRIAIEIVDYCLSSCFNYLFLAATEKVIKPNSILGFHGIATTSAPFVARVIKNIRVAIKAKKKFYESIGIKIKTWEKLHKKIKKMTKYTDADMFVITQKFFDQNRIKIDSPWFPKSQDQLNLLLEEINKRIIERRKKPHKTWEMIGDFS